IEPVSLWRSVPVGFSPACGWCGCHLSSSEQAVKTKRVSQTEEIARRPAVEADPGMKIHLLGRRNPPCPAKIEQMPRSIMVGVVADIFGKQVGMRADLSLHRKGRFIGRIAARLPGKPEMREHAVHRPPVRDLARPGNLQVRVVGRPGNRLRPGRHPEAGYRRRYEVPGQPFELPL